jgi:dephospho-CoA kinase
MLERFGARVIDADQLARDAVMPGTTAYAGIVEAFGPEVLQPNGCIDRERLGARVFADPLARRRLEEITHPAIGRLAEERLAQLRAAGVAVTVYMAPLLIEAGVTGRVDEIWVVYVDGGTQISRLMARDGLNREEAQRRIAAQMPMAEKRGFGKVVIDNSGSLEETEQQVREAWGNLCQEMHREA